MTGAGRGCWETSLQILRINYTKFVILVLKKEESILSQKVRSRKFPTNLKSFK
jgi:hypothetical protein